MKKRIQYYYRGSLRSCDYSCSYCPFCKCGMTSRELEEDEKRLTRFVDVMLQKMDAAVREGISAAVQIVPYGEALIHSYYWRELARLSRHPALEYVGAQSNFSFSSEDMLAEYRKGGGILPKLRLWGTFHPEMISAEGFVRQCGRLLAEGVSFCVGAVGVPEHVEKIRALRKMLPGSVYVWINKMDGLGRNYTEEEKKAFLELDEYFQTELAPHRSQPQRCGQSIFVESDGTMRGCNIAKCVIGDFYSEDACHTVGDLYPGDACRACGSRYCHCFLSYCNLHLPELIFFEPYPAFRIPQYPRAAFFDVDGTLVDERGRISGERIRQLRNLARHTEIYLATSLPFPDARRKMRAVWNDLSGGAFAGGAMIRLRCPERRDGLWEKVEPLEQTDRLSDLCDAARAEGYHVRVYRRGSQIYKITIRPGGPVEEGWHEKWQFPDSCQVFLEGRHLQIVRKGTGKLAAVQEICRRMGYGREEVFVAGDSAQDEPLLEYYRHWSRSEQ